MLASEQMVLTVPDIRQEFEIHVDGSATTIAALLLQADVQTNKLRPIAYASRQLNLVEQRFSSPMI